MLVLFHPRWEIKSEVKQALLGPEAVFSEDKRETASPKASRLDVGFNSCCCLNEATEGITDTRAWTEGASRGTGACARMLSEHLSSCCCPVEVEDETIFPWLPWGRVGCVRNKYLGTSRHLHVPSVQGSPAAGGAPPRVPCCWECCSTEAPAGDDTGSVTKQSWCLLCAWLLNSVPESPCHRCWALWRGSEASQLSEGGAHPGSCGLVCDARRFSSCRKEAVGVNPCSEHTFCVLVRPELLLSLLFPCPDAVNSAEYHHLRGLQEPVVNVSASARLDTAQREGKRPQLPAQLEGSQGLNGALG